MTDDVYAPRLDFARKLGGECAAMARDYFARLDTIAISRKGLQDVLTEADGAVERLIRSRVAEAFPGDFVLGEEEGGGGGGDHLWVVDPIDGTANFARGLPHYCVSIAFVARGVTEIGVIDEPAAGVQYWTRRGAGAYRDERRLRVSPVDDPTMAMADLDFSRKRTVDEYVSGVKRFLNAGYDVRKAGSAALALARVADGRLDLFYHGHLSPWDVLAGELMVRESGGVTSGFSGPEKMARGGSILACTQGLWASARAIVEL